MPKNFLFRNCTELYYKNVSRWGMRSSDVEAAYSVCYFLLLYIVLTICLLIR